MTSFADIERQYPRVPDREPNNAADPRNYANNPRQPTTAPGSVSPGEDILQFFAYDHLPDKLKVFSQPFGALAQHLVAVLPANPERSVALRKLLEAKDAAVRASIYRRPALPPPYPPRPETTAAEAMDPERQAGTGAVPTAPDKQPLHYTGQSG